MRNFKILFLLLFIGNFVQGQSSAIKELKGKILSDYSDLEGVYIINLKTDIAIASSKGGFFLIKASVGDTLLFSAVQLKGVKVAVKEIDFKADLFFVKMEMMINQLEEVKINQFKNINSVSLGLVSKNQKQYTPAERRLKAAGDFKAIDILKIVAGGLDVEGLLNKISGRTAMLTKNLIVERKELLIKKINDFFSEEYFVETLKIPADYTKGFEFYLVEDEKFVAALNAKNKTMATFLMGELAVNYLKLIMEK